MKKTLLSVVVIICVSVSSFSKSNAKSCSEPVIISQNLDIQVPHAIYQTSFGNFNLWVNFTYVPNSEDRLLFEVTAFDFLNQNNNQGALLLFIKEGNLYEWNSSSNLTRLLADVEDNISYARYTQNSTEEIVFQTTNTGFARENLFLLSGVEITPVITSSNTSWGFDFLDNDNILIGYDKDDGLFEHTFVSRINIRTGDVYFYEPSDNGKNEYYMVVQNGVYALSKGTVYCHPCVDIFYGSIDTQQLVEAGSISNSGHDEHAEISPDATQIAYVKETNQLVLFDMVSRQEQELTSGSRPKWLNSNVIAFSKDGMIYTIDLDTLTINETGLLGYVVDTRF